MKKIIVCSILAVFVFLAGCEVSSMTPEEIAEGVAELYTEALKDLAGIIRTKPEVDSVKDKVLSLRENVIQKMVRFGNFREKLTDQEKTLLNSALATQMIRLQQSKEFKDNWEIMSLGSQYYRAENREFGDAIGDFNIITQYSQFELLKRQNPKEAERLGIE